MGIVQCAKCGEYIDRGACNQEYAVVTIVRDTDATGTKKERQYVCEYCVPRLEIFLMPPLPEDEE